MCTATYVEAGSFSAPAQFSSLAVHELMILRVATLLQLGETLHAVDWQGLCLTAAHVAAAVCSTHTCDGGSVCW